MKTTIDYSASPAKNFDAVEDIKKYFRESGRDWNTISAQMSRVTDVEQFTMWADFAGISGFPVRAWYDLYHGEGSYAKQWRL